MLRDLKTESEVFRGQRWLTTALLVVLAAAMVVLGLKELASGQLLEPAKANPTAGVIPARLAIPGMNFEVALTGTNLNQSGQLAGAGWLKSSSRPGEAGTAVIGINQSWPVANLQPGDRLEITGQSGQKLAFEIISRTASAFSLVSAGQPSAANKELKLVVIGPGGQAENLVISARLVTTN